ncbi:hypothetical protein YK48G_18970 [Lentilactobacillus fungorum]|uniref:MucBP domain protein n=1 Tax=Lentilactobacillus fungorum TaxID=2201250 RepID=A0ABQ3W1T1_9LACO|nr:DUF5776 domain-containing protein [Lentilactobacillus fungorum]GHP14472.1 hypothetical protein YK48G_18970 [Lentilactobacillus fungorum]
MVSNKKLIVGLLASMLPLFSMAVAGIDTRYPVAIIARANTAADQQAINEIMPNQKLQLLVLLNLKREGIVSNAFQLSDFTLESFKADLAQLKALQWPIGTKADSDATEPVDGGNGTLGPINPGNYSLRGIEYATNLTKLSISVNYGYGHRFYHNDITDLSPLKNLTKLTYIDLVGNRISDISPIAELPNVTTLYINENCITNLNVLNAKQYTNGFNYLNQVVVLPAVDLPDNSYTWQAPFKNALPQNTETTNIKPYQPYDPKWIGTGTTASGFPVEASSPYQHIQVFRNGIFGKNVPPGKATINGDDIDYSGLAPQIQPSMDTTDPWGSSATVVRNPDTYYMIGQYRYFLGNNESNPFPVLTYFLPYTITPRVAKSVTVNYVDEQGNQIHAPQTITGSLGQAFDLSTSQYKLAIAGYTFKGYEPAAVGTISDQAQTFRLIYTKNAIPENPTGEMTTTESGTQPTVSSQPQIPLTPAQLGETTTQGAAATKTAVYALKKIYLYQNADFKKSERKVGYVKKPRVFRPMFVIDGVQYSKAGRLRYQVRDVNHDSSSAGMTGLITANAKYVRPVYYQTSHSRLTVINPKGINAYQDQNLTRKVKHFKQGQVLKVKGIVKHRLTTRYRLADGNYITGNRKLVQMGRQKMPKQVVVKRPINRYQDANLTKRNGSFKKGSRIKVTGYTYSHPTSLSQSGTKRLQVAGGYMTANKQFVKVTYK